MNLDKTILYLILFLGIDLSLHAFLYPSLCFLAATIAAVHLVIYL
jgi:hypothetical protein